jgi:hypothetical protein
MRVIFIVVAIAAISLSGYFFFQNQILQNSKIETVIPTPKSVADDETANWKTYTNNNLNISFKYPSNLFLTECSTDGRVVLETIKVTEPCFIPNGHAVIDIFIETVNTTAYESFLVNLLPYKDVNGIIYTKVEKFLLDGKEIPAIVQFREADMTGSYTTILVYKDNLNRIITISFSNEYNKSSTAEISKKILGTFRFLE